MKRKFFYASLLSLCFSFISIAGVTKEECSCVSVKYKCETTSTDNLPQEEIFIPINYVLWY
ncbi:MAG: hypothetical protein JSU05_09875 [Bacteroidetes bacterium]|nr:hypothetical protein [Bacteroidota bacterium]